MGVPKFFRYISERYPCLSELVKEYQIPEFDNLYLDMNGIIHMCSHPNDFDPHFRITEERIFKDIFHYLEILFQLIKPRKLFFMAVDGVAPRAKMNQQRGRRFRSAKEAEDLEKQAEAKGEKLPTEARFDSNCITPGTVFMARLHDQLKYFVSKKISSDPQWQGVKVILSGHETPGEGEHKIMDYIRWMKKQPGYDPNTRHCLYGLDADLMMLGLCTHEPHFSLLREEVKFGKQSKRTSVPEEVRFYLLHLSLMREYLDLEFQSLKTKLKFPYDLEHIIDDWVLMGFLVGNDFIPHLPHVHIATGALPMLYKAYIEVLPTLEGYINENGHLRLDRFQKFMEKLAAFDVNQFKETYADMKYFESKTNRKMGSKNSDPNDGGSNESNTGNSELDALIKATNEMVLEKFFEDEDDSTDIGDDEDDVDVFASRVYEDDSDSEMSDTFKWEFHQHKKDYYRNKLEYGKVTEQVLRDQAEGYVRAIQWNLHYYYHGVASWSWYYPHHYAPYVSDICNFKDISLNFELGQPFKPFEQLLAVLPSASKSLLPAPYRELMIQENSPILEYYPQNFQTDLNGKKQEWEAVVLIPFIDEQRLLSAMVPCEEKLSDEEKARNQFGPMLEYTYSEEVIGEYKAPQYFPTIKMNHAKLREIWRDDLYLHPKDILHGLPSGVRLDVYFPGFPTFKHLPYKGELKKAKVQVFDQASRGESMVLTLINFEKVSSLDLKDAADHYLGKNVYCGWPHMSEARVVGVADGSKRYNLLSSGKIALENLAKNLAEQCRANMEALSYEYMRRLGVDIGTTKLILYVNHVVGRKYCFGQAGKITLEKQYTEIQDPYAIQTIVEDIAVHDTSFVQFQSLEEVFPQGSKCFLLASPVYGSMAEVLEVKRKEGRLLIKITTNGEPDVDYVRHNQHQFATKYMPGSKAAQHIGISSHILSRVTGTVFLVVGNKQADNPSKINIGLNLKFNKKNEEVPGYTKKVNNMWLYSRKAVAVIQEYVEKFPEVFEHLAKQTSNDVYNDNDVYPGSDCAEKVSVLSKWLKDIPSAHVDRQACGAEILDDEVVAELNNVIKSFLENPPEPKRLKLQVKPHTIYKHALRVGNQAPDKDTIFQVFDRVVNVRDDFAVPLGLKGTIIGIRPAEKEAETMFDVLFDQEFPAGMNIAGSKGNTYRLSRTAIINISHGYRKGLVQENYRNVQNHQPTNSAFAKWSGNWRSGHDQVNPGKSSFYGKSTPKEQFPKKAQKSVHNHFTFPAPPNIQILSKERTSIEEASRLQLWDQLQKASINSGNSSTHNVPPPPELLPKPSETILTNVIESKTNALKMILGMNQTKEGAVNVSTMDNATPNSSNHSLQEKAERNLKAECEIAPYAKDVCGYLLQFFQRKGVGIPMYSVATVGPDNFAQLKLPDGTVVIGKPSPTKQGAAENAAMAALHLLNLCRVCGPDGKPANIQNNPPRPPQTQLSGQPQQFFAQFQQKNFPPPLPFASTGNSKWQVPGNPRQPMTRPAFHQAPPPFAQTARHLNQETAQTNYQYPSLAGQPSAYQHSPQKRHLTHNNHYRREDMDRSNHNSKQSWRQQGRPTNNQQDSNSFVPLQAMKKQRNVQKGGTSSINGPSDKKPSKGKDDIRRESASVSASPKKESAQPAPKTFGKCTSTDFKEVSRENESANTKCQESAKDEASGSRSVSRMRKSRLAINFQSSSDA